MYSNKMTKLLEFYKLNGQVALRHRWDIAVGREMLRTGLTQFYIDVTAPVEFLEVTYPLVPIESYEN